MNCEKRIRVIDCGKFEKKQKKVGDKKKDWDPWYQFETER